MSFDNFVNYYLPDFLVIAHALAVATVGKILNSTVFWISFLSLKMQNFVLLNIFPTIPNLLRLKNFLKSYRQKKKDCTLILNTL